jgi:hypothetical protein
LRFSFSVLCFKRTTTHTRGRSVSSEVWFCGYRFLKQSEEGGVERSREERRVQTCRGWTLPGSTFATLMSKWRLWSVCTMSAPNPALSGASSSSRTALSLQTLNPSRSKSGSRTDGAVHSLTCPPSPDRSSFKSSFLTSVIVSTSCI